MKKIPGMIDRNASVLTGKENLEQLLKLENFPVFFGCVDPSKNSADDLVADMEWAIDPETGIVQLTKLIPLEILYQEQHVDGVGKTWEEYYSALAEYIAKNNPSNVLEIGGGIGVLANKVTTLNPKTHWTIIEPNPVNQGSDRVKVIEGFFDSNFKSPEKYDVIAFSQVMEHVYDPRSFLKDISGYLQPGEKLVFAYPHLALWLERNFTNALNFEHTMLFTDHFIDALLPEYRLKTTHKQVYKDHSFFYTVEKTAEDLPVLPIESKYVEYKRIFSNFVTYHKTLVAELNKKMEESAEPTYFFGAHIFATWLFAFGLNQNALVTLLDNSSLKRGRRMYGTNFIVESPETLRGKGPVNLILKAGLYNEEIKQQVLSINPEVTFW